MGITSPRYTYKTQQNTFEYGWAHDAWLKCLTSVWNHNEVSLDSDLKDWSASTAAEKSLITSILKGFTQIELHIGDYWAHIADYFPKPEIIEMARAFSFFETIHAAAYNHLVATLGLDEYQLFMSDQIAQDKVNFFKTNKPKDQDKLVELAIFSGAGEGVSLFSSFALLLAFNKTGRFKGIAQILSWSLNDEHNHSEYGTKLYHQYKTELSSDLTPEQKTQIKQGFNQVIENELRFLDQAFSNTEGPICDHNKSDYINFLYLRANDRLKALDLPELQYDYDLESAKSISKWFLPIFKSSVSNDFFAHLKSGENYVSKPMFNPDNVNFSDIKSSILPLISTL